MVRTKDEELAAPVSTVEDKWKLLPEFLRVRGLMKQHIDSFNYFMNVEMNNIVTAESNQIIRSEADPTYYIKYLRVEVRYPMVHGDHGVGDIAITPFECRLRDFTYSAPIVAHLEYTRQVNDTTNGGLKKVRDRTALEIGRLPIMLRSDRCLLQGKSDEELSKMKECMYDPGGYFVIKGVEKVILMHEQLSKNRVIIELDAKENVSAAITSSTHDRKSRCNIFFRNNRVYLKHNSLGDEIPIVVVLKAMGLESDQEIMQLIGSEEEMMELFVGSLEEPYLMGIYNQQQALNFIGSRVKQARVASTNARANLHNKKGTPASAEAVEVLAHVVLNHVPVEKYNFRVKVVYITHIVRRVLSTVMDRSLLDDKDHYGNKRLELAGSLISLLFEDLFKRFNSDAKRQMDLMLGKQVKTAFDPTRVCFHNETITQGFVHAISTGSWVLKRFRMDRAGVTQVLSRLSYISALGMMSRVSSQFEKTRKVSGPRSLQPSQWGMMCPADTPEGEACGLVKNLALLTHVTTDEEHKDGQLRRACFDLGVEDVTMLTGDEINAPDTYLVFLNGMVVGVHIRPKYLVHALRRLRRTGSEHIGDFVSVYLNQVQRAVFIASDGGRVCRPLLLVEKGRLLLTKEDMQRVAEQQKAEKDAEELKRKAIYLAAMPEEKRKACLARAKMSERMSEEGIPSEIMSEEERKEIYAEMGRQGLGGVKMEEEGGDEDDGKRGKKKKTPVKSSSKRQKKPSVAVKVEEGEGEAPMDMDSDGDKKAELTLEDLIAQGKIEYVDVNEENNCLVALNEADITSKHTHMEIDPMTILGVVCGLVPYPHHNQSPRNTYQCAMGKQAIGTTAYNQYERFDSLLYTLIYPQKPLVTTRTLDLINFDKIPGGQNASMCVMSYSGYDIEDAIVLNKASIDRGFGRCMVVRKHHTVLKTYPDNSKDECWPKKEASEFKDGEKDPRFKKQEYLDHDGLVTPGEIIDPGHVLINKATPPAETINLGRLGGRGGADDPQNSIVAPVHKMEDYKRAPVTYRGTEKSVVDKVLITNGEQDAPVVKVLLRQVRRPEVGDKFSSRHGQKGVCGLIVNQEDMPFSEVGIVPDLIMNPHGFPSRMTVGKMIEIVAGKAGALRGEIKKGSAFGEATGSADRIEKVCEELVKKGYSYHGKDYFTSGTTGEPIQGYIFAGPVFYQKLKHMVMDKMHARAKGPRAVLTRQPTEGRSRDGGLRLGEMERDCLISYGASNLIMERLMFSSDAFTANVCEGCGLLGYEGWCQRCRRGDKVSSIKLPYACKLLFQELQSMNVATRLRLQDF